MTYHLIILLAFKHSCRNTPLIGVQLRAGAEEREPTAGPQLSLVQS